MNSSTFLVRVIEHVRQEVRPDFGGGNPATGEFWSTYRDGTRIVEPVLSTMPGTVARHKALHDLIGKDFSGASFWALMTEEHQEAALARLRYAYANEDNLNLYFSDKRAREMYLAGVNAENTGWLKNVLT